MLLKDTRWRKIETTTTKAIRTRVPRRTATTKEQQVQQEKEEQSEQSEQQQQE